MTRNGYDDDGNLPGPAGVTQDLERAWKQIHDPEPDEVDRAIATLRSARSILADGTMMDKVRKRQGENRKAISGRKGAA